MIRGSSRGPRTPCRGWGSNPHGRPLRILSPPRLPVPPPRLLKIKEATAGFEPANRGFADPRLNLLATSPLRISNRWSGRRDLNPRPPPWQGGALPLSYFRSFIFFLVPRRRFELLRVDPAAPSRRCVYQVPPPRHWQGWKDSNLRPPVLETGALPG